MLNLMIRIIKIHNIINFLVTYVKEYLKQIKCLICIIKLFIKIKIILNKFKIVIIKSIN